MHENVRLLLLYLAICAVILMRVAVEDDGFTTPDSVHYIAAAETIKEDLSFTYTVNDRTFFLSLWPSGYPVFIALIKSITPLSYLWSSKLVNLLWLGFGFLLIRKYYPVNPTFIAVIFCANSMLDIFSYTWTEAGFTVGLLWVSLSGYRLYKSNSSYSYHIFEIVLASLLAYSYRYVGGFILFLLAALAVLSLLNKKFKVFYSLSFASLLLASGIGAYFWFITQVTGHYSGATRIPPDESFSFLVTNLSIAQVNEFFLIRKLDFEAAERLSLVLLALQIILLIYAAAQLVKVRDFCARLSARSSDTLPLFVFATGIAYWMVVVGLRFFVMKFDLFDFRILAPTSFLCLVSVHMYLAAEHRAPLLAKIKIPIMSIYLLALAHGLYKKNLIDFILAQTKQLF